MGNTEKLFVKKKDAVKLVGVCLYVCEGMSV